MGKRVRRNQRQQSTSAHEHFGNVSVAKWVVPFGAPQNRSDKVVADGISRWPSALILRKCCSSVSGIAGGTIGGARWAHLIGNLAGVLSRVGLSPSTLDGVENLGAMAQGARQRAVHRCAER